MSAIQWTLPSGQTTRNSRSKSDPSRAHRSQRGNHAGPIVGVHGGDERVERLRRPARLEPEEPVEIAVPLDGVRSECSSGTCRCPPRSGPPSAAPGSRAGPPWSAASSSSARWRASRMLLAFCSATDRSSCSSSSSVATTRAPSASAASAVPAHPRANLCERRVAGRRGVVAERREPAIVGRAQLLDRNVLGRFEDAVAHFLRRSRRADRSARRRRRRPADRASCTGG